MNWLYIVKRNFHMNCAIFIINVHLTVCGKGSHYNFAPVVSISLKMLCILSVEFDTLCSLTKNCTDIINYIPIFKGYIITLNQAPYLDYQLCFLLIVRKWCLTFQDVN